MIRGNQAYLPNIAASPEGPLRFNVSTQAFVNVLDNVNGGTRDGSQGRFLNLHLGARTPEAGKKKLFFANVWAIGFTKKSGSGAAYVVSAGSDLLVKVNVAGNGALSFTGGPATTRYIDLNDPANPATAGDNAGKNPQGIVVNKQGTKAWVNNFVSRNVSVVDLKHRPRPADHPHRRPPAARLGGGDGRRSARRCSSARAATSAAPAARPASGSRARAGSLARAATSRASPTAWSGRSAPARASRSR